VFNGDNEALKQLISQLMELNAQLSEFNSKIVFTATKKREEKVFTKSKW
jgi:hypothetical protein